jgi:hypothetical protein
VASDCSNVIWSLKEGTKGSYAHIAQEITESLGDFEDASFCHVGRRSNKEAHCIARSVVHEEDGRRILLLNPPEGFCIPMTIDV